MAAPENLKTLVNNYEFHRPAYLRGQYNETQLRREFVDKFFNMTIFTLRIVINALFSLAFFVASKESKIEGYVESGSGK